jgi:hypothetical protein
MLKFLKTIYYPFEFLLIKKNHLSFINFKKLISTVASKVYLIHEKELVKLKCDNENLGQHVGLSDVD